MATDTAAQDVGDKKLVQDSLQTNGDLPEKILMFDNPRPQRLWRLNRRGFFMSSHDGQTTTESPDINIKVRKGHHQESNSNKNHEKRSKSPPSSGKKIIKLSSSTKNSHEHSHRSEKFSSSHTSTHSTSEKKVIKLSSSTKSSEDSNLTQKRSSSDTSTHLNDQTSEEMQPKKKHKPITWP